jgi:1-acyl-sn-glycerol-3-phosphate acyltransferase
MRRAKRRVQASASGDPRSTSQTIEHGRAATEVSGGTAADSRRLRAVDDLQAELGRLDRALAEALRANYGSGEASSVFGRWLARAGLPGVGALIDRFERVRGSERDDDFGIDLEFEELVKPFFVFLYRRWWRVETRGLDRVPADGAALLVANHGGTLFPYDAAMLKVALKLEHPSPRELRPLVDDFVFQTPFFASLVMRVGGVRACHENAERLLRRGEIVGVFPEGMRGMKKSFFDRYRLERFGRGFVSLALRTGAPIVPTAVVGAEEIHPLLGTWKWPTRLLGVPYFPVTPTFPWLGVLGLVPLPSKWRIHFGEPVSLGAEHGRADADDPALVDELAERIRGAIQAMVNEARRERGPTFFGGSPSPSRQSR